MANKVVVRIRYPVGDHDRAQKIAKLFRHPEVSVELIEDKVDEVIVEGPVFATDDLTLATALIRRFLIAQRNGRRT